MKFKMIVTTSSWRRERLWRCAEITTKIEGRGKTREEAITACTDKLRDFVRDGREVIEVEV